MSWRNRKVVPIHRGRWRRVRRRVLERDKFRCVKCGRAGRLEVDHKVPLWRDRGQNPYDPDNLQTLCRNCHIKKTAGENRPAKSPEREAWARFLEELAGRE